MPRCYQLSIIGGFHTGQEDCLFLNVYTPMGSEGLLPVMVYLHGGGFVAGEGSSTMFGPHFFMDEGVLLVTVQYRLGIFGFLSTGQEGAPVNLGLWDQREALLSVRDNIAGFGPKFGGDPDRVTLFAHVSQFPFGVSSKPRPLPCGHPPIWHCTRAIYCPTKPSKFIRHKTGRGSRLRRQGNLGVSACPACQEAPTPPPALQLRLLLIH